MKIQLALTLLTFSMVVIAGEKIDKSLEVSAKGKVEIHNNRGEIVVSGWDKNEVSVKGELDDLTEKFIFSSDKDKTIIKVVLPDRNSNSKSGRGSNLEIFVPNNTSVQFGGVATNVLTRVTRIGLIFDRQRVSSQ